MQSSNKQIVYYALAAIILLIAALVLIFTVTSSNTPESVTSYLPINSQDVASKALSSLLDKPLESGSTECQGGDCQLATITPPEKAWKLLAFSAMYGTTQDPSLKNLMESIVRNPGYLNDSMYLRWNLLPFRVAYLKTHNPEFNNFFTLGVINATNALDALYSDEKLNRTGIFLTTQLMRSLLMSQPELSKVERELGEIPGRVDIAEKAQRASRRLRDLALKYEQQKKTSWFESEGGSYVCWYQLNHAGWYEATKDDTALESAKAFFFSSNFLNKIKAMKLTVLQQILPCVEAALILSKYDPKFNDAYHDLVESFVLPSFDSDLRPLCKGNNRFISALSDNDTHRCESAITSVADISWIVYLLADRNDQYLLHKVRS